MKMSRTWDSTMSMIPKGGDTIWGGLNWSPEEDYVCNSKKGKSNGDSHVKEDGGGEKVDLQLNRANYGRIISFGKDVAESYISNFEQIDFQDADTVDKLAHSNASCHDVWTEYQEMGHEGMKAVSECKVYTTSSLLDLLHFVAPKMMQCGDSHFS